MEAQDGIRSVIRFLRDRRARRASGVALERLPRRGRGRRQRLPVDANGLEGELVRRAEHDGIAITHVLCTHGHGDHVVGIEELGGASRRPLVAHPSTDVSADERSPRRDVRAATSRSARCTRPGHCADHLAFLVGGTHCFTADVLFRGTVGGTPALSGDLDELKHSILRRAARARRLDGRPPRPPRGDDDRRGARVEPVHPRVAGGEGPGEEPCRVSGEDATLLLWAPDYDGGNKALVRLANGRRDDRRRFPGQPVVTRPAGACRPRRAGASPGGTGRTASAAAPRTPSRMRLPASSSRAPHLRRTARPRGRRCRRGRRRRRARGRRREHDRRLPVARDDDVLRPGCARRSPTGPSAARPPRRSACTRRRGPRNASCALSRWYIPIRSPGSRTLMLIPKCGNRRFPSKVQYRAERSLLLPARGAASTTNKPSPSTTRPFLLVRSGASGTGGVWQTVSLTDLSIRLGSRDWGVIAAVACTPRCGHDDKRRQMKLRLGAAGAAVALAAVVATIGSGRAGADTDHLHGRPTAAGGSVRPLPRLRRLRPARRRSTSSRRPTSRRTTSSSACTTRRGR